MAGRPVLRVNLPANWGNIANDEFQQARRAQPSLAAEALADMAAGPAGRRRSRNARKAAGAGPRGRSASRRRRSRSRSGARGAAGGPGRRSRSRSHSRRRSRSRSRSRSGSGPEPGDLRRVFMNGAVIPDGTEADRYETSVPVERFEILGDDGKWVEAYNVNRNYGGPYTNMRQLQANPHYASTWEKELGPGWVKKLAQARRAEKKEREAKYKGEPWPPKGPGGNGAGGEA